MKRIFLWLILGSSGAAWADSWIPPSTQAYLSQDKSARLTVVPRDLESALAYFEDKTEGREPAGARAGSQATSAIATLERLGASGRWEIAWTKPLVNEVGPVDVVVANKGQGFATFDNWHSMGYGADAIAIYDGNGQLVRKFGLEQLFPGWFVAALPRSVSSLHWRGEPRISSDGARLIVPVVQPTNGEFSFSEGRTIDLAIRLADGAPIGVGSAAWKLALNDAAVVARADCASEREAIRQWNAPISAPTDGREKGWHQYLNETQYRTNWHEDAPVARTTVLRFPSAADYAPSLKWLDEALTEAAWEGDDLRAIGSPDIANLTTEIEWISRDIRRGQLKGVDLAIVADAAHAGRIRTALARSGAKLKFIDPKRTFPQITQRMRAKVDPPTCRAPRPVKSQATAWLVLPILILGGCIFLLRRR
jgi:hypothetical protein